jgi:hypothetical protein
MSLIPSQSTPETYEGPRSDSVAPREITVHNVEPPHVPERADREVQLAHEDELSGGWDECRDQRPFTVIRHRADHPILYCAERE